MTPTQKKFLEKYEETKKLHPEVLAAIKLLADQELNLEELGRLFTALAKAPDRTDAEYHVGGIIRG